MLERLKRLDRSIRIAIVGVGSMGKGLLHQSRVTPGIQCVAIADVDLPRAVAAAESLGYACRVVREAGDLQRAIRAGVLAACEDGELLARCELVDVLVEASNSVIPAARVAITALERRRHLVLMNSEIDLAFGPYLLELARENDVTFSSCDGDQHGVIRHLVDDLRLWGFDLVMAGNIKGFLDRYANPATIVAEADKRNLGYRMATAYTDGSKLCIEMALLANALGLAVTVPGMRGPRTNDVHDVFRLFDLAAIHASGQPVVEYILGAQPDGGVFAVGHCDDAYQQSMLRYYKMGDGPFYLFYRPYHLCHIEAMEGIARAYLDRTSVLRPDHGFRANVYAYAKRPLRKGETLDGLGGFACYGLIENCERGGSHPGLPICLAEDLTLERDIPRDAPIRLDDVRHDPGRLDFALYAKALAVRAGT